MIVEDFYPQNKHRLTNNTIKAIEAIKTKNLIYQFNRPIDNFELHGMCEILKKLDFNSSLKDSDRAKMVSPTLLGISLGQPHIIDEMSSKINYIRDLYQTRFIGSAYHLPENAHNAETRLVKTLNGLGEKGLIKGNLLELSHIQLGPNAGDGGIFVSYLLFDQDGVKYLEDNDIEFKEGGMPRYIDGD